MQVISYIKAARRLQDLFDQIEEQRLKKRRQEDADYEIVSARLRWLLEQRLPVSVEILSRDTDVPIERIDAISYRLGKLAQEYVDADCTYRNIWGQRFSREIWLDG
jgi:hypothetical protein